MIDAALAAPGFVWLAAAYLVAGVVRGFTGFGTALIVVPVAGASLAPQAILVMIAVTGLVSNVLLVPGAWQPADRGEVGILSLAALICVPVGVWAAGHVDATALRWVVAGIGGVTVTALIFGLRFEGRLGTPGLGAVGAGAGLVGGLTALTGPIAILFYLANARRAEAVRANMILFLAALDVLLIANVAALGALNAEAVLRGLLLCVPYVLGITAGMALFDPARERTYRAAALTVVALAVISGLPIWE